ncbi:hypothetical protein Tco_0356491 [Tanacetum coccineum]
MHLRGEPPDKLSKIRGRSSIGLLREILSFSSTQGGADTPTRIKGVDIWREEIESEGGDGWEEKERGMRGRSESGRERERERGIKERREIFSVEGLYVFHEECDDERERIGERGDKDERRELREGERRERVREIGGEKQGRKGEEKERERDSEAERRSDERDWKRWIEREMVMREREREMRM